MVGAVLAEPVDELLEPGLRRAAVDRYQRALADVGGPDRRRAFVAADLTDR